MRFETSLNRLRPTTSSTDFAAWQLGGPIERWLHRHPLEDAGGDGHPVLILRGDHAARPDTAPLRDYCRMLGYDAQDVEIALRACAATDRDVWLMNLASQVGNLLSRRHQRASLIGWGDGGAWAIKVAHLLSDQVRQVITLRTDRRRPPSDGDGAADANLPPAPAPAGDQAAGPSPVPTTEIVECIGLNWAIATTSQRGRDPMSETIMVRGSHAGMGWNPAVLRVVADRLAQGVRHWQPYLPGN